MYGAGKSFAGRHSGSPWTRWAQAALRVIPAFAIAGMAVWGCSDSEKTGADSADRDREAVRRRLAGVHNWLYVIDVDLTDPEVVDSIANSEHDMVVIDFVPSIKAEKDVDIGAVVRDLKARRDARIVIAYLDIGQAEDFRTYWHEDWDVGSPDWILGLDPDGWPGDFPVAYWSPDWQAIWLDDGGLIDQVKAAGFDGVYLDWVEAYDAADVVDAADRGDVDPRGEMVRWVTELAEASRDGDRNSVVVVQNAADLVAGSRALRETVDAVAQEHVWFDGGPDGPAGGCPLPEEDEDVGSADYADALPGECRELFLDEESSLHSSSRSYVDFLVSLVEEGIPVFTVDYAIDEDDIDTARSSAISWGFIPFVGTRKLDSIEPAAN